jgi:hypothetical protein
MSLHTNKKSLPTVNNLNFIKHSTEGQQGTLFVPPAQVWFLVRREPLYHKLQYAKTPKFDPAAAILGVVVGAFVGYMTLSSVGSVSVDLTDLTLSLIHI